MARRSKITLLPASVKKWLDQALVENNFSGYRELSEALKEHGYEISKSAVHKYGQDFEERLAALKLASEQAKAVVTAAPDDEGAVNEALMRLVQEHLFKLMMAKDQKLDLPKLARAVAELGRASVVQKKWQAEVRAKAEAAASAVEKIVKKGGMSDAEANDIRRHILCVAE